VLEDLVFCTTIISKPGDLNILAYSQQQIWLVPPYLSRPACKILARYTKLRAENTDSLTFNCSAERLLKYTSNSDFNPPGLVRIQSKPQKFLDDDQTVITYKEERPEITNLAVWWPVSFKTVPILGLGLGLEAGGGLRVLSAAGMAPSGFPVGSALCGGSGEQAA